MLKTAVALSNSHAPVNQIPFAGRAGLSEPRDRPRGCSSRRTALQTIYTQFMTGQDTRNPKRVTKTTKRKKVTASKVSGLENARNLGENLGVLADAKLHFPFYFPEYRTVGSRYNRRRRARLQAGRRARQSATRRTAWWSPPAAPASTTACRARRGATRRTSTTPDRVVKQKRAAACLLFYDGSDPGARSGGRRRRGPTGSRTRSRTRIANTRMIAMAASLTHLAAVARDFGPPPGLRGPDGRAPLLGLALLLVLLGRPRPAPGRPVPRRRPRARTPAPGSSASAPGGVLRFPQAVATGPDGAVYVADQYSHAIQVFGPDGAFRRELGSTGKGPRRP